MGFPAWDPVLLDLPGPLDIRWYGLMYVVAFIVAQIIFTRLARAKFLPTDPDRVADLIFYTVIGTILGGRLGYALFYDQGLANPLKLVRIWEGGLSFHGGLIGVTVALVVFSRKNKIAFARVCDAASLAVPPGIFAVRMANFINGELFGRVTSRGTFGAMQFPTDPRAKELLGLRMVTEKRDEELAIQYAYRKLDWGDIADRLHAKNRFGQEIPWDRVKEKLDWEAVRAIPPDAGGVPFRHPSQLYEGLGEGLVLGLVLWAVYRSRWGKSAKPGTFAALFLCGYSLIRFCIEFVRQPDAQFRDPTDPLGTVLFGMTMGQTLCSVMLIIGVVVLFRNSRRAVP